MTALKRTQKKINETVSQREERGFRKLNLPYERILDGAWEQKW